MALFSFRNYVETIANLRDASTVELFYLNAKRAIFTVSCQKGKCDVLHTLQSPHQYPPPSTRTKQ